VIRQPYVEPKPYTRTLWEAIAAQEADGGVIILPSPKDADERKQLAAFLERYRAAAAKGELFDYEFRLGDGTVP
jgi:hypothetical protein